MLRSRRSATYTAPCDPRPTLLPRPSLSSYRAERPSGTYGARGAFSVNGFRNPGADEKIQPRPAGVLTRIIVKITKPFKKGTGEAAAEEADEESASEVLASTPVAPTPPTPLPRRAVVEVPYSLADHPFVRQQQQHQPRPSMSSSIRIQV